MRCRHSLAVGLMRIRSSDHGQLRVHIVTGIGSKEGTLNPAEDQHTQERTWSGLLPGAEASGPVGPPDNYTGYTIPMPSTSGPPAGPQLRRLPAPVFHQEQQVDDIHRIVGVQVAQRVKAGLAGRQAPTGDEGQQVDHVHVQVLVDVTGVVRLLQRQPWTIGKDSLPPMC